MTSVMETTTDLAEPKWYEGIEGIDSEVAIGYSGTEDVLRIVMETFYETYESRYEELQSFFDNNDWENYTIKVHALKSSSRLIGALETGDRAEALEMAGKSRDLDFIRANHDKLMDIYKKVGMTLAKIFEDDSMRTELPQDTREDAYTSILEFAGSKDFELVRMVMDSIKGYKLLPDDEDRFKRIQTCLSKMDWDGIISIVNER